MFRSVLLDWAAKNCFCSVCTKQGTTQLVLARF